MFFVFLLLQLLKGAIIKCAASDRDHTKCCLRRGIPSSCLHICRGIVSQTPVDCLASYGSGIIQCYDEGEYILFLK